MAGVEVEVGGGGGGLGLEGEEGVYSFSGLPNYDNSGMTLVFLQCWDRARRISPTRQAWRASSAKRREAFGELREG